MQKNWICISRIYSLILIILGLIGYFSNPEKAITSLILASGVGVLIYCITLIPSMRSLKGGRLLTFFLFLYASGVSVRAFLAWSAFQSGYPDKFFPATLLTVVASITYIAIIAILYQIISKKK